MKTIRLLIAVAVFGSVLLGEDITVPLDDGNLLIHAHFIQRNEFDAYIPELTFQVENQTSSSWRTIRLRFDIGGLCNGEPRQWTRPVVISLGWLADQQVVKDFSDWIVPLVGKVDGCTTEIIKASLLSAEGSPGGPTLKERRIIHIDGVTGEEPDFTKQLQELEAKIEAEAAIQAEKDRKAAEAEAERERIVAEAQAKQDAADAARRKRLAAEQKRKQAEADARYAKIKAEEDARASEERKRVREVCASVYKKTVDKKVSSLTVGEEQQVRECQVLGLYY